MCMHIHTHTYAHTLHDGSKILPSVLNISVTEINNNYEAGLSILKFRMSAFSLITIVIKPETSY